MTKNSIFSHGLQRISPLSATVLKLGLALACLQTAVFAIMVHDTLQHNPLLVPLHYPPLIEYVALPFVLVIAGALLFDSLEREKADR